jgi:chemotaxis signal transduction protein
VSKPVEFVEATSEPSVRMVAFEVAGGVYALPIADVLEVADIGTVCCVPTLPPRIGGVMNHHGDAVPVVHPVPLLEVDVEDVPEPEHAVVVAKDAEETSAWLALPVDRVVGLVDALEVTVVGSAPVVDRQPIAGRLVQILNTANLVARAVEIVERSVGQPDAGVGG